ncbi:MAG: hypothetical protein HPY58_05655 [Firmicutes bacterium]|nr:hypothetical protein [Bacillota bacterium]
MGRRELAVPLTRPQVEAALQLYRYCELWQSVDEALDSLARSFPGFDFKSTLLKAAAVNALYWTQVYAVVEVARHMHRILEGAAAPLCPDLVESLGRVPGLGRKFRSFASKFAHFFIDPERFPIYDSYAVRMVTYHVEGKGKEGLSYEQFATGFAALKKAAGFPATTRELDRYLWLAGQYRAWKGLPPWRRPSTGINPELQRLFEAPSREVQALLEALLGRVEGCP